VRTSGEHPSKGKGLGYPHAKKGKPKPKNPRENNPNLPKNSKNEEREGCACYENASRYWQRDTHVRRRGEGVKNSLRKKKAVSAPGGT